MVWSPVKFIVYCQTSMKYINLIISVLTFQPWYWISWDFPLCQWWGQILLICCQWKSPHLLNYQQSGMTSSRLGIRASIWWGFSLESEFHQQFLLATIPSKSKWWKIYPDYDWSFLLGSVFSIGASWISFFEHLDRLRLVVLLLLFLGVGLERKRWQWKTGGVLGKDLQLDEGTSEACLADGLKHIFPLL